MGNSMILITNRGIRKLCVKHVKGKKRMPLSAFLNFQLMIGYIRDVCGGG